MQQIQSRRQAQRIIDYIREILEKCKYQVVSIDPPVVGEAYTVYLGSGKRLTGGTIDKWLEGTRLECRGFGKNFEKGFFMQVAVREEKKDNYG